MCCGVLSRVVLFCVVLCCVLLRCFVLCCVVLCCVVLCCVVLCCVVLCCVVLCCVVLCCVVLCCVVLCCVVLCCVVLRCVVLCRVVLCCVVWCGVILCRVTSGRDVLLYTASCSRGRSRSYSPTVGDVWCLPVSPPSSGNYPHDAIVAHKCVSCEACRHSSRSTGPRPLVQWAAPCGIAQHQSSAVRRVSPHKTPSALCRKYQ